MKKIINNPSDFVEESIDGLIKSHPDVYAMAKDNNRVITRANKASKKVGIVTGGGSGHLPVFTGYVGKGFLDACAIGSVFASPSVEQMVSAIKNADFQVWVLGSSFDSNINLATRRIVSSKLSKLYSLILDTPSELGFKSTEILLKNLFISSPLTFN